MTPVIPMTPVTPATPGSPITLPLDHLLAHPLNANHMSPDCFEKLVAHIERTGRYPPIIVRPAPPTPPEPPAPPVSPEPPHSPEHPRYPTDEQSFPAPPVGRCQQPRPADPAPPGDAYYQILDGHHRVAALRRLGRTRGWCVVWPVDDAEALLLLATLNRLQGQDDPRRRAALLARLTAGHHHSATDLARTLPETREQVDRLLQLSAAPPPARPPQPLSDMPVAVHFFLPPAQRDRLEQHLHQMGGPREEALMRLLCLDPRPAALSGERAG